MTPPRRHTHATGLTRRELLQVGYSALLGLSLPELFTRRAAADTTPMGRARSVVLVFQTGAPSHIDTFDLKPEAPDGIRSPFASIATVRPRRLVLRASAAAGPAGATISRSSDR